MRLNHFLVSIAMASTVVGCSAEVDHSAAETVHEPAICLDCPGGEEEGETSCSSVCSASSACHTFCTASDGAESTCGAHGVCGTCTSLCSTNAPCSTGCKVGSSVTSCGGYGLCRKHDVYCAYPVITSAEIWDNHESGAGGAYAYMYFGSALPKSDTFPSRIGGFSYDPNSAWASNFRGPGQILGESARPQWEWYDSAPGGLSVSFNLHGTPYIYGRTCLPVLAGAPMPALGVKHESVYEDDECFGPICNSDDCVGSFQIDRSGCNSIFDQGAQTGWTMPRGAIVGGDIRYLNYRLWCYSCKNSESTSCTTGVE